MTTGSKHNKLFTMCIPSVNTLCLPVKLMPSELFASAEGRKKIVYILGLMANGDTA